MKNGLSATGFAGSLHPTVRLAGLTLIEVMIALAVLSIGLTGLASMHLNSLQYVHSAYYHSMASIIAIDFEERLWLELGAQTLSGCPESGSDEPTATALIADWSQAVNQQAWGWPEYEPMIIPNLSVSTGTVTETTQHTEVPVTFSWNESRFGDIEPGTEQFHYTVRILCRQNPAEEEAAA